MGAMVLDEVVGDEAKTMATPGQRYGFSPVFIYPMVLNQI